MSKVISYCLWGNDRKYVIGLRRNLLSMPEIYPGWGAYIHWGHNVTLETRKFVLGLEECQARHDPSLRIAWHTHDKSDWTLMLDRFGSILKPDIDVMISRDADSRLTSREKAAVDEWLASDKGVHVMHDHPHHSVPMLGGMWGCKRGAIPGLKDLLASWPGEDRWQTDQEFLTQKVWPLVKHDTMNHDQFFRHLWGGRPFPTQRIGEEFVGATIDENEQYVPEQVRELRRHLR